MKFILWSNSSFVKYCPITCLAQQQYDYIKSGIYLLEIGPTFRAMNVYFMKCITFLTHLFATTFLYSSVISTGFLAELYIISRTLSRQSAWFNICVLVFSDVTTKSPSFVILPFSYKQKFSHHHSINYNTVIKLFRETFALLFLHLLPSWAEGKLTCLKLSLL